MLPQKTIFDGSTGLTKALIRGVQGKHSANVDYSLWKLAGQGSIAHCRRDFLSADALCSLMRQSLLGKAVDLAQLTIVVLYLVQRRQNHSSA